MLFMLCDLLFDPFVLLVYKAWVKVGWINPASPDLSFKIIHFAGSLAVLLDFLFAPILQS